MVNRMRSTRSHTGNRRSHHALRAQTFAVCPKCHAKKLPQFACPNCGAYKGRQVVDVFAKLDKKERKKKEKELAAQEAEKPMDAAALSQHTH
ncbi:MAG: 50S ribosomal protein L32 [Candidatus Niyogibacteria bacterium]|nr:50S ribosomal protein L32 [Candidatus Niyogibacteria bacterium]